jgi:hypothetical protein
VIQTFELAWKDTLLLLDQVLSSLEKQWGLAQPLRLETISNYKNPQYPCHLEIRDKYDYAQGAQSVPLEDPHWDQNGEEDE